MLLPQPNGSFRWMQTTSGRALSCRPLEDFASHVFTTRRWMLGGTGLGELQLDRGWSEVARAIRVDPGRLVRARQVHGTRVIVAPNVGGQELPEGDILISGGDANLALAVQVADCVPLLLADRRTGAVAAVHAGWRGLAARAPEQTVAALGRECGSRPADLIAAVGPSIGACCYEIGAEVRGQFEDARFELRAIANWFLAAPRESDANASIPAVRRPPRAAHWFFDAWSVVRDQLTGTGVPPAQIFVAELCTASHQDMFCSYRRDGSAAGRQAAAITGRPLRP
jgi:YfiH family protein